MMSPTLEPHHADWLIDHEGTPFVPLQVDFTLEDVRLGLAFHEAGHAVLCMAYGIHVITTGIVSWQIENGSWNTVGNTSWEAESVLCRDIAAQCAAGELAHLRHLRETGRLTAETAQSAEADHDREQAIAILATAGVTLSVDDAPVGGLSWREVSAVAGRQVDALWSQISALAVELTYRELSGDEAAAVAGMTNPPVRCL